MFKQARAYGDRLTVIVSTDKNAGKIKGIGPFHNEEERRGFLSHFDLIDEVYVGNEDDPYKCLIQHKPDIIALGYDQKVFVDRLEDKITEYGLETRIVR
ncbi:MAG: FAD synthase, partial [Candidatus Magasanikbacteria bacterium]